MRHWLRPARFLLPIALLACNTSDPASDVASGAASDTAPDAAADIESDTALDTALDTAPDTAPGCPGPPPVCTIAGGPADCGTAFWDTHGKTTTVATPRQLCTLLCGQDPAITLSGQAIVQDKTSCVHMNSIAGLDCSKCCHLPDVPAPPVPCPPVAFPCAPTYSGGLPGAQFDLTATPCQFSIAAAKGQFLFPYRIVVTQSEHMTLPLNLGNCKTARVFGGIGVLEQLDGNNQKWCLCDTGNCNHVGGVADLPLETTPGTYHAKFQWDGRNFNGPSDVVGQPGAPFPPGIYTLRVQSSGKWHKADGTVEAYSAEATLPVKLEP